MFKMGLQDGSHLLFLIKKILAVFVPRFLEEKRGDIVFGFPWCVVRGA